MRNFPQHPLVLILLSICVMQAACKREIAEPVYKPATGGEALAAVTSRLNFLSGTPTKYGVTEAVVSHPLPGQQSAKFNRPAAVASDGSGGIWVSDYGGNQIKYIVVRSGFVLLTFGTGSAGSQDGDASVASFNHPSGIALGPDGLLYVSDKGNNKIRVVNAATNTVSTFAGSGVAGFADGPVSVAKFNQPAGIAIDVNGTFYIADQGNNMIRRITGRSTVTRWCGQTAPGSADGAGANSSFNQPLGIALSPTGSLYVADLNNNKIRKITSGTVTTFAGSGLAAFKDGIGTDAAFNWPAAVATDSAGNVYVTDYNNANIRFITSAGAVSTLAGGSVKGSVDGWGNNAQFLSPNGITVDPTGTIYITDEWEPSVRKMVLTPAIRTLAGGYTIGNQEGTGYNALFGTIGSGSIAAGPDGSVYVVDNYPIGAHEVDGTKVRKITPQGTTSFLAGNIMNGYLDGPAQYARFGQQCKLAVGQDGTIYVADENNCRVRKIANGVVSTVAGNGQAADVSGIGTNASINYPTQITTDAAGNVYTMSYVSSNICRITPGGVVSVIHNFQNLVNIEHADALAFAVNTQGHILLGVGASIYEYTVDNQEATLYYHSSLIGNLAMTIDGANNLYLEAYSLLYKLTPDRQLYLLGGSPDRTGDTDGPLNIASVHTITGLAVSPGRDRLYMTDWTNYRVRMISTTQ